MKWILTLTFAMACAGSARADEILFVNGDRLSGRLLALTEGTVRFATEWAGVLEVPAKHLLTFATDDAIEIHRNDGTVLLASVATADAGAVRTRGGESLTLRLVEIAAINPPPAEEPRWKGRALLGAQFERGNAIKDEGYVKLDATRRSEKHRTELRGVYDGERTTSRSTGDSTTNDRNLTASVIHDFSLSEVWSWYLNSSAERDGPSGLDLRFKTGIGIGYAFFDRTDLRLMLRAGPVWVHDDFAEDANDDDRPGGEVGWQYRWDFGTDWSVFSDGTYTQSFEEIDASALDGEVGLRADLTGSMFVEAKLVYEWYSEQPRGIERQDVDYIFGVGYEFE